MGRGAIVGMQLYIREFQGSTAFTRILDETRRLRGNMALLTPLFWIASLQNYKKTASYYFKASDLWWFVTVSQCALGALYIIAWGPQQSDHHGSSTYEKTSVSTKACVRGPVNHGE
jgi:hypothetical protein